jgi:hypothetical protein
VAVGDSDVTHLPDGLDLADAAALPLIALTGDQLVRHATNVRKGQVVLITGALGSVGRAAVHSAKKIGAQVIAGVRRRELEEAGSLGVAGTLAIDDDEAVKEFRIVDAIADIVGGEIAAKLITKIKPGGSFGYTAVLLEGTATHNPYIKISRVFAKPDPSKVREFADDLRDGKFILPIGRQMPLRDAAEAHVLGQKGGIGKIPPASLALSSKAKIRSAMSITETPVPVKKRCRSTDPEENQVSLKAFLIDDSSAFERSDNGAFGLGKTEAGFNYGIDHQRSINGHQESVKAGVLKRGDGNHFAIAGEMS